jgi:RNA polymerase sigma factor (sigma-70 family)
MPAWFFKKITGEKPDYGLLSDEQLASEYHRSNDPAILGTLYKRYTHILFGVYYKYLQNRQDAEDGVMKLFERLFEILKNVQVHNFKSWIYTLAKNDCLMQLRHKEAGRRVKEENLKQLEAEIMEIDNVGHPMTEDYLTGRLQLLQSAILQLNEAQGRCIQQFYLEGRSYQEVADFTGFTMNEVKSHLQNGRRNLKIYLEKAGLR